MAQVKEVKWKGEEKNKPQQTLEFDPQGSLRKRGVTIKFRRKNKQQRFHSAHEDTLSALCMATSHSASMFAYSSQ